MKELNVGNKVLWIHAFSSYYIEARIFEWYFFDVTTQIMLFLTFTSLQNLKESSGICCSSLCPTQHMEHTTVLENGLENAQVVTE